MRTKYWTELEKEFGLEDTLWAALQPPPAKAAEKGKFDLELPQIVLKVVSENPADRSAGLTELGTHLNYCEELPLKQVYGLLSESIEGPAMKKAGSYRMQLMILKYIAKWEVDQAWPEMWEVCRDRFEKVLISKWQIA